MSIERKSTFRLLLSDDEWKLLELLAEREGLSPADYLRALIRTAPSTSATQLAQTASVAIAARNVLGAGIDVRKLFEAHANAMEVAKFESEKTKKRAG